MNPLRKLLNWASLIKTLTTSFDGVLESGDDTVQKALDKLDDHTHPAEGTDHVSGSDNQDASEVPTDESGISVQDKLDELESGSLTLGEIKADTDIASAISLKHSNALDHSHANKALLDSIESGDLGTVDTDDQTASEVPTNESGVSVQDALDALTADQHTQGTDQTLDDGGINEVSVANIKDAVDKRQSRTRTLTIIVTNPTSSDNFLVFRFPEASTITAINAVCMNGTSVTFKLKECDENGANAVDICNALTALTTNVVGTITNPGIGVGHWISYVSTDNTGSVTKLMISVDYTVDL